MLRLITNILDDGIKEKFYTLEYDGNSFALKMYSAIDLMSIDFDKDDTNFIFDTESLKIKTQVPVSKIFRDSHKDFLTETYAESGSLFWFLDKVEGIQGKLFMQQADFTPIRYKIDHRPNCILKINGIRLMPSSVLMMKYNDVSNLLSEIDGYYKIQDDYVLVSIGKLPITKMDIDAFDSIMNDDTLFNIYLYVNIPYLCEEVVAFKLNKSSRNMRFLPDMQCYKTSVNTFKEESVLRDKLKRSRRPLDKTYLQILNSLESYSEEDLMTINVSINKELRNRLVLLYKIKYLCSLIYDEADKRVIRNDYGVLMIRGGIK